MARPVVFSDTGDNCSSLLLRRKVVSMLAKLGSCFHQYHGRCGILKSVCTSVAYYMIVRLYKNIAISAVRWMVCSLRLAASSKPRCCLQSKCVTSIDQRMEDKDKISRGAKATLVP